ncbi:MAG: hypothetical protein PHH58_08110 [Rhodoferax sp.]|nr:hypothetical protein [Rhodoferax sp.]
MPALNVQKSVVAHSDRFNASSQPKAIPGALMAYSVTVSNAGAGAADDASTVVTDLLPAQVALYVADLGAIGSGPLLFTQGSPSSGLSYTFTSLASNTDDVDFSADNGVTWSYLPVPGSDGCDPLVTGLRSNPKGSFVAASSVPVPSFALTYRVCIK